MTTPTTNTASADRQTPAVYVYFVAIQYFGDGGPSFTNMEFPLARKLTSLTLIQQLEQHLRDRGYHGALVLGLTLLRTEPAPGPREQHR